MEIEKHKHFLLPRFMVEKEVMQQLTPGISKRQIWLFAFCFLSNILSRQVGYQGTVKP